MSASAARRGLTCLAVGALTMLAPGLGGAEAEGGLPRGHPYQRVLLAHVGGFEGADLEVPALPLHLEEEHLGSPEDVYRLWILLRGGTQSVPLLRGLRMPARRFVLREVEADGQVRFSTASAAPEGLAWWSEWDHPANPYRGMPSVRRRALVAAVIELVMLDDLHERGKGQRADRAAGPLIRTGYTYWKLKPHLPEHVQAAFETGLRRVVTRVLEWGPAGVHADMDAATLVGLWHAAAAIDDPDLLARVERYARGFFSAHVRPAGYVDHGGGYDPSYNGISLHYLAWLVLASDWEFAEAGLRRMIRLKACTALPEVGGNSLVGPTHFATVMSGDAPHDQWGFPRREIALAMVSDDALYLLKPARRDLRDRSLAPSVLRMRSAIAHAVERQLNPALTDAPPPPPASEPWRLQSWSAGPNYAHDHYPPGFYTRVRERILAGDPAFQPPLRRDAPFVEAFDDEFLVAHFGSHAVVVHTGRLAWWKGLRGFSGGAVSAFWTPSAGPVLLGRRVGRPSSPERRDRWATLEQWMTHAVSGRTSSGVPFSSGRFEHPKARFETDAERAVVEIEGGLVARPDDEGESDVGSVARRARITAAPDGVRIEEWLTFEGTPSIDVLWLSVPLFGPERSPRASVRVDAETDVWTPLTTSWSRPARQARVLRGRGGVVVHLDRARRLRLGPPAPEGRALLVEIAGRPTASNGVVSSAIELRPLPPR